MLNSRKCITKTINNYEQYPNASNEAPTNAGQGERQVATHESYIQKRVEKVWSRHVTYHMDETIKCHDAIGTFVFPFFLEFS